MMTILVADNKEKAGDIIAQMLNKEGNIRMDISKEENIIRIVHKDNYASSVSLKDKILELEDALYSDKRGRLYKSMIDIIEKPIIERVLERTEGNQLKAARILGINRNTIRSKIAKLGIDTQVYKI